MDQQTHDLFKQLSDASTRQTALLEAMAAKEMAEKAAADVNEAQLLFSDGGMWIGQGLDRDIVNTYVKPSGLEAVIPKLASVTQNPLFGLITGIEDDGAAPATNPCDDNPTGFLLGCTLTAQFGRNAFDTNTIEFDRVMLELNTGVTTDLNLRGSLLNMRQFEPSNLTDEMALSIVTASEMVKVGMLHQNGTSQQMGMNRMTWQGAVANNTSGGGYKEFPGLDAQIATGHIDALLGTACAGVDSDVKDFNYSNVDGTGLNDIVEYLSMLEFYVHSNARKAGLLPATWVLSMREELWQELTAIWPIAYNTNRGAEVLSGNTRMIVDGGDMIALRDAMRESLQITINGRNYPVILDDGIAEGTNINNANVPAGSYSSSIYFVPLTITGGFPVTYFEHVDYRAGASDVAWLQGKNDFWTDAGVFSWAIENNKWCYKLSAKTEQRVILRTPQLAGRIDNVLYSPLQHIRTSEPGGAYTVAGGVSIRGATALSAVWK